MRKGCVGMECTRAGRQCSGITETDRREIFQDFYKLADLQKEREFVARHIETTEPKVGKPNSRRSKTHAYYLTVNGKRLKVCRNTFLATLSISEKFVRVVLSKITETGVVEEDKRGGRQSEQMKTREEQNRDKISRHIDRFSRVESHYCRASSSKEYLSPDLTLSKMYDMYVKENSCNDIPSFHTYRRVFKTKSLAFHSPKKDQCSLCNSFRKGDEAQKNELREIYNRHEAEKQKVRQLKEDCKKMAQADHSILAGNFDLQQVIYLPISHEDALFYKRRLSNFNLTFYNLGDHTCDCFIWHEGQSRRGSSEISTAVCRALREYDQRGIKTAYLFADGCPGQNKNTIMPTMMLHMINTSAHMEELSLRYFESFHGQCEGDSAHSAISTALGNAGDVFLPSQLFPIIALARRKQPYKVHPLEHGDFLNYKKLSEDLKVLNVRKDNQDSGVPVNWNKVMEVRVNKAHPTTI
ncbi:uncharacterized protein LOC106012278 [Aplysia californica]|uniref:Uncharacterized protein LOC106012278 n=1 Tax=Aplysia californica TaxID=6500 RepID=A0ABM1A3M5_APLCA|nr:uncharacterized protein LOC106012278 [Aplysia californica]